MVIYQIATFHRIKTVWVCRLPALTYLHRGALHLRPFSQLAGSFNKSDPWLFECRIDAEPIYRYTKGGYHPVHLGDILNNGTYRILHKLGWGSYSTVWAAKNLMYAVLLHVFFTVSYTDS